MVSIPRRPARPVSCVYWAGVSSTWESPLNLVSFSMTTVRAGILIPSASVSVAKTTLTSPRTNSFSTMCLNAGSMPAWWAAKPRMSACRSRGKLRSLRSAASISSIPSSMIVAICAASSLLVREIFERRQSKRASSQPAREKMKSMAGSMPISPSARIIAGRLTREEPWRLRNCGLGSPLENMG